jgi:hypothetical protein
VLSLQLCFIRSNERLSVAPPRNRNQRLMACKMRPSKATTRASKTKVGGANAHLVPQQKIKMPKIEPGLRIEFDLDGSAGFAERMDRRTASFLGTLYWSWSPANERTASYYLQRRRTDWILWLKLHFALREWLVKPFAIARCQREGFAQDYKAAAMILLAAVLTEEIRQNDSPDRFHEVFDTGLLSTEELDVVAETVWGKRAQELLEQREEIAAQKAAAEREAKLNPYRALIDEYVLKFSDAHLRLPGGGSYPSKRFWVKRFIEDYVLDKGRLPDGKHRIKVETDGCHYSGDTHDFGDLTKGK